MNNKDKEMNLELKLNKTRFENQEVYSIICKNQNQKVLMYLMKQK